MQGTVSIYSEGFNYDHLIMRSAAGKLRVSVQTQNTRGCVKVLHCVYTEWWLDDYSGHSVSRQLHTIYTFQTFQIVTDWSDAVSVFPLMKNK